jgi:aryl-alcohol dehydrogenase-like predicted oxidoreductase
MRLSTDLDRDDARSREVLRTALEAGVTLLDTAPSYCQGQGDEHHNERLIANVLSDGAYSVRVSTKGGLIREGKAWIPDGRAGSLLKSCEASLVALERSSHDLYFLHAPDPRVSFSTSVRALARLKAQGLVRKVGLSNVSVAELEEALGLVEVTAIQVAFGAFDDAVFRSGLVRRALDRGVEVHGHSPLGGPKRGKRLARDSELIELARKYQTTPGSIVLAWFYGLHPSVVLLPGAGRPETARQAALAPALVLDPEDRERLDRRFSPAARTFGRGPTVTVPRVDGEVVLIMGIQGAGKSRHVQSFVERGYERLNRDERGGTLKGLALELDERLARGARRVVLDNTYGTRATRSRVLEVAGKHGLDVHCIWLDTPLEAAQVNTVQRLLERYGKLPSPDELRELSRRDPNAFLPNVQFRYRRELEPPAIEEGFSEVEIVPFERAPRAGHDREGLVIAADRLRSLMSEITGFAGKVLAFAWLDGTKPEPVVPAGVELAVCAHGGGPPVCWCRPPLPGLVLEWMLRERVDPLRTRFYGANPQHRALASALGMTYLGS